MPLSMCEDTESCVSQKLYEPLRDGLGTSSALVALRVAAAQQAVRHSPRRHRLHTDVLRLLDNQASKHKIHAMSLQPHSCANNTAARRDRSLLPAPPGSGPKCAGHLRTRTRCMSTPLTKQTKHRSKPDIRSAHRQNVFLQHVTCIDRNALVKRRWVIGVDPLHENLDCRWRRRHKLGRVHRRQPHRHVAACPRLLGIIRLKLRNIRAWHRHSLRFCCFNDCG